LYWCCCLAAAGDTGGAVEVIGEQRRPNAQEIAAGTPRSRLPTTADLFEGAFSFLIYLMSIIKRKRAKNAQREES
jgi:hypothetical protein